MQTTPTSKGYGDILIYGANGYTAGLIIELTQSEGARPVLAGRNPEKLGALANQHGLEAKTFALENPAVIAKNLAGISVVLNCAGPFARTAEPLARACMKAGAHYLDITGEFGVFEALASLGTTAHASNVMLMPGVGFDVVPSDCLASHMKRRMPDATSLTMAFQALGQLSHGTATTIVENVNKGGCVRRGGKLVTVPPASSMRDVDFGDGPVRTMCIPWGDISTAWHSTQIPDIEVFMAAPLPLRLMSYVARYTGGLLGSGPVQRFLKKQIDAAPAGPDADSRKRGRSLLWAEVRNARGQSMHTRLTTVEGYTLTAVTAWDIAKRAANGEARAGFRTPSMVFGPDYILNFAGSTRSDID